MRLAGRIVLMLVGALMLVACGSESSDSAATPDVGTPPPPTATPTAEPTLQLGNVIWTDATDPDSGAPAAAVTVFNTESAAINAVIEAENVDEGTVFTATWTINDQPIDGTTMTITADGDMPHAWIAFTFTRDPDQRYPAGQLSVVITSSDGDLREGSVEIALP